METIKQYQEYAESIGCVLSKHAENIIKMVVNNNFQCPCKKQSSEDQLCPCPDHIKEIQETGSCTCNLFIKDGE